MYAALFAVMAVAVAQTPAAPWTAPSDDSLQSILAQRIARGGGVGLVVAVTERGVPRCVAVGRRAGDGSPPLDCAAVFEIGSVSKVLTGMLLAQMSVAGDVTLGDPVQRFLPADVRVPSRGGRAITLEHLATATSGLPRVPDLEPADSADPYADFGPAELHAYLSSHELARDPGESYEYSNLGAGLLGHALALRAGMPYEQLVIERLLQPLGMNETRITLTPVLRARLAGGHGPDLEPAGNWEFAALAGAGAWRSTAPDMMRLMAAMLAPPPVLAEAIALSVAPRQSAGHPRLSIGLGWHVLERGGVRIVWHNGETGGFHSFVGFVPTTGANVVVLSNATLDIDDIGMHVLDPAAGLRTPAARDEVAVSPDLLERHVGRYELVPGFVLTITRREATLFVQATGQPRFRLYAASPTRFFLRVVEADVGFTLDDAGRTTGVVLYQGGRETAGRRLP